MNNLRFTTFLKLGNFGCTKAISCCCSHWLLYLTLNSELGLIENLYLANDYCVVFRPIMCVKIHRDVDLNR